MFLRKSRKILRTGIGLLRKKGHLLLERERIEFESDLRALDQAILNKQRGEATLLANKVKSFTKTHFHKTPLDHLKEISLALAFAVVVAFFIRQFWFELYEVPTGSMRPTIEELDRMLVSKTTFGITLPFREKSLLFSDKLIKRGGIIVLTGEGMDIPDNETLYFGMIPGKKRYVKRAMGKPGDTVYFYGGLLYGIDKEGNEILELADPRFLEQNGIERIDHVPYITYEGRMGVGKSEGSAVYNEVQFKQMNTPVAKMQLTRTGKIEGTFYNGKEWVKDRPDALRTARDEPVSYSDLWGIGNYAMARLLTRAQAERFYEKIPENGEAKLYLELKHTPNLTYPKPTMRRDEQGRVHPMITPFSTLIPLDQPHLEAIQKALYTARFRVENGRAFRYQEKNTRPQRSEFDPLFPDVPNGLYEFYYGTGYKVHAGGYLTKLPESHPLYSSNPDNIQKLFNLGIGFNLVFEPMANNQPYNPQRFAYYREGDLYLMGAPILKKQDPTLIRFIKSELEKQESSSREAPYIAFVDHGAPLKEGKIDHAFIQAFGLKIPEWGVLGLGDNYAMSADSRDFGFIPTDKLMGAPTFTFWPLSRIGPLVQPSYPWITPANLIVWGIVALIALICWLYWRKRNSTSYFN